MRPAPGIAWVIRDGVAYLAHLPGGPIIVLDDSAALIWAELTRTDSSTVLVERVRAQLDDPPVDLAALIDAFVAELVADGWVAAATRSSAPGSQSML